MDTIMSRCNPQREVRNHIFQRHNIFVFNFSYRTKKKDHDENAIINLLVGHIIYLAIDSMKF